MREPFRSRLSHALASESIPVGLGRALGSFRDRRAAVFAEGEFPRVQAELRALKADALDRLPELVAQFTEEATREVLAERLNPSEGRSVPASHGADGCD